jgi:hypothetical protein
MGDLPESETGDWPTAEAEDSPESGPEKLPEMKPDLSPGSLHATSPLPPAEKDVSHSRQDSGYQSSSEPTKSSPTAAVRAGSRSRSRPFSPGVFRTRQAREELLTSATAPAAAGVPPQAHSGLKAHLETQTQVFSAV